MITKLRHSKGFSLIEMMLVIAIIAAITVLGLAAYEQKVLNFKVDKTSLQIQMWLQASVDYYATNNEWPTWNAQTPPPTQYIPNGLEDNPWGTPYQGIPCSGSGTSTCNNNDYQYEVSTTLPAGSFRSETVADNVAQMIASHLPSAQAVGTTIYAQINSPPSAAAGGNGNTIITDVLLCTDQGSNPVGDCTSSDSSGNFVDAPTCGPGYSADIETAVSNFNVGSNHISGKSMLKDVQTFATPGTDPNNSSINGWTVGLDADTYAKTGHGSVIAITMCRKNTTSMQTAQKNPLYAY